MKIGVTIGATLALTGIAAAQTSLPGPDPEPCPLQAEHTAMSIRLVSKIRTPQGKSLLVNCHYRKEGGSQVSEIGFQVLCPKDYRLTHPGYALNGVSRTELRITAIVPTGGNDSDFVFVSVFPASPTLNLDLNIYALCRSESTN